MSLGKHFRFVFLAALTLAPLTLGGCNGGSSGGGGAALNAMSEALQDLTADPEGTTTVLTFDTATGLALADETNFEADGGQTAQTAVVAGDTVTVTWDARVTPSDRVRATGLASVSTAFEDVTTSDASEPTFTATGDQNPGLGSDTITVTFAGPHVVEALAEDPTKWTFSENSQTISLAGSAFVFSTLNQTVTITLSANVGLHTAFTLTANGVQSVADVDVDNTPVVCAATGDAVAPGIVSAAQNLTQDEFGRVIDFTFTEAMDPFFSEVLSHFAVTLPDIATTVDQISPTVLRVGFNNPIVPGHDQVTLTSLVDAHGNAFPNGPQAITQPSPVANGFAIPTEAVTVQNAGGDSIVLTTTQAFDPDAAVDPTKWTLTVAGNPVNLALQTFDYDFLGKTLTINLAFDMVNGTSFTITGNGVFDVDGQAFGLADTQTVAGDATVPTILSAIQNRNVDPTGKTIDIQLSEDVQETAAETLGNWFGSSSQNLVTATLLPSFDAVRLAFDGIVVPGDLTLTAQNQVDLAGNAMPAPQTGITFTSTDTTRPSITTGTARAIEGALNDTVTVTFDDDIIDSDVETETTWAIESPVGTPRSIVGATVVYDAPTRTATLTFANGQNLKRGDNFKVGFTGVRDIGGNFVTTTTFTGAVDAETNLPTVNTVWRDGTVLDRLVVRFSEPCDELTDLYDAGTNPDGTRFALRTSGGLLLGYATSSAALDDGLGVEIFFGIVVAASDTLDVLGVTDLAGNPMFPALALATVAEDTTQPSLAVGMSSMISISGDRNDAILVVFDRPMSPWTITSASHYSVMGGSAVDLTSADITFDGNDTVTIRPRTPVSDYELITGFGYDLTVDDVFSAQGTQRTTPDTEFAIMAAGDSTAPNAPIGKVRIDPTTANSLLVEFDEAMSPFSAQVLNNYALNGSIQPGPAVVLGPRDVRLSFLVAPIVGDTLDIGPNDLAGNGAGGITRAVTAADAAGPLVSSVQGISTKNWGGDLIQIAFNEPVTSTTALNRANYAVTNGGNAVSITSATLAYDSTTDTVSIRLPGGVELDSSLGINVTVGGIKDFSGNTMAATVQVGGVVIGDTTPPAFQSAFVNQREDATSKTVDVLFSEDVDSTFASTTTNWTATASTVTAVVMLERNHARVTLSAALAGAGTLQLTALPDLAGNTSAVINVNPVE